MTFLRHQFGLDLADATARFAGVQSPKHPRVRVYSELPLDAPVAVGPDHDPVRLGRALRKVLRVALGHARIPFVGVAVPDAQCFVFSMPAPEHPPKEMAEAIRWEAAQHLPYSDDAIVLDWRMRPAPTQGAPERSSVIVAAMERAQAERYAQVCDAAGMTATLLTPASLAIAHAYLLPPAQPTVLVRVGNTATSLSFVAGGMVLATILTDEYADTLVTRMLCDRLHLTVEEAVKAQRVWGVDPAFPDQSIRETLAHPLDRLTEKLRELLEFAAQEQEQTAMPHVLFTGPGSMLHKLPEVVAETLHLLPLERPTPRWQPTADDRALEPFCAAIGVALPPLP